MDLLLDTHIFLWAFTEDKRLTKQTWNIIEDKCNTIYYSIVSMWEVAIKYRAKPAAMPISGVEFLHYCEQAGFTGLPVFDKHIAELENLGTNCLFPEHKDPFDRLLVAQARSENLMFLTHDRVFSGYDEGCVLVV